MLAKYYQHLISGCSVVYFVLLGLLSLSLSLSHSDVFLSAFILCGLLVGRVYSDALIVSLGGVNYGSNEVGLGD